MNEKEPLSDRLSQVGQEVREAGRNVWLAGLGVVGTLDERGREVFSDLVGRGEKMDGKVDREWLKPVNEAAEKVRNLGEDLERRAEDGMNQTLHRLGMPSRQDVQHLIAQVEKLSEKVEGLSAAN